jgi:2-polyprenyl-6-methoxyphenol hydroxylase-like FAD-dependent oxidoreductase
MLAARVLSDHFKDVKIVERDRLPSDPNHRRGIPHGRHAHALLAGGLKAVEELFPGFRDDAVARGAIPADPAMDGDWFFEGASLKRCSLGCSGILLSRPFLETQIRERIFAIKNISIADEVSVRGLKNRNGVVTGLITDQSELAADLVVDATGRGSQSLRWLGIHGFTKPPEEKIEIQLTYTTRIFERRPNDLDGDVFTVIAPTPDGKRGGVAAAQENDRWIVTLFGHFTESAPPDISGFRDYARTLPSKRLYKLIANAEPIGEASTFKYPASVRRRYEKLESFPSGFLVFGDAICSFNPIYGQGMSSAALQAVALNSALETPNGDLAQCFFTEAGKVIDGPWDIAAGADLRMPETIGPRSRFVDLINWYVSRLHKTAHSDAAASHSFIRVAQLLDPPAAIMSPKIAFRILRHSVIGSGSRG